MHLHHPPGLAGADHNRGGAGVGLPEMQIPGFQILVAKRGHLPNLRTELQGQRRKRRRRLRW